MNKKKMNKLIRKIWLCVIVVKALITVASSVEVSTSFDNFIKTFNKPYACNSSEYWFRLKNFQESLKRIEKLNRNASLEEGAVKYGITKFSDLSKEEFQTKVLNRVKPMKKMLHYNSLPESFHFNEKLLSENFVKPLPTKIDWRQKGAVTPVKNQKNCGACWAFSVVQTIESMNWIRRRELKELSVQQVIDCALGGRYGCNGGSTCDVLVWMNQTNFNLTTEAIYPLTDEQEKCRSVKSSSATQLSENFTCTSYVNREETMARLLAFHGPIVAAVDATSWQDYLGGIIRFHCDTRLNHAVEIVGYDFSGKIPYYIVRNSWGKDFGLDGYLYIASGKNLCGIAEYVSTLDVK